jgi:hypothetical protein
MQVEHCNRRDRAAPQQLLGKTAEQRNMAIKCAPPEHGADQSVKAAMGRGMHDDKIQPWL